jgi:hypothetical protein
LGHTELLIDHEHELPPEVHWSLALLLRTGQRLIDVVAGICDLIHVASVDPHAADAVDVSELVAHELAACRDRADQRGVLAMAAGDVGAVSVADSRRLRRELLDNALTYAPDQSTVCVTVVAAPTGMRIEVSDHGDGIEPADRERVVRPFERGTNPRQPSAGCGMGSPWHPRSRRRSGAACSSRRAGVGASEPVSTSRSTSRVRTGPAAHPWARAALGLETRHPPRRDVPELMVMADDARPGRLLPAHVPVGRDRAAEVASPEPVWLASPARGSYRVLCGTGRTRSQADGGSYPSCRRPAL